MRSFPGGGGQNEYPIPGNFCCIPSLGHELSRLNRWPSGPLLPRQSCGGASHHEQWSTYIWATVGQAIITLVFLSGNILIPQQESSIEFYQFPVKFTHVFDELCIWQHEESIEDVVQAAISILGLLDQPIHLLFDFMSPGDRLLWELL